MRLIDADVLVTMQVYDDEHEEYRSEKATIAELLDRYTDEGCPPEICVDRGRDGITDPDVLLEEDISSCLQPKRPCTQCWECCYFFMRTQPMIEPDGSVSPGMAGCVDRNLVREYRSKAELKRWRCKDEEWIY